MTATYIGQPRNRVDGPAKVTGAAQYAAEFVAADLLYGYIVSSEIARGKILSIDTERASAVKGVVTILTHENRPRTAYFDYNHRDSTAPPGSPFRALYDDGILFSGQPIALVVATTFEQARFAASLVKATYKAKDEIQTALGSGSSDSSYKPKERDGIPPPIKPRGDADKALASAPVRIEADCDQSPEHHNPLEMHASTVIYESDGSLTIYDKTQGVQNCQSYIAGVFGLSAGKVHVLSPYVGGAFGSGLRPYHQLYLATMAALTLKRSVRVVLTRQQMFTFGHRPTTKQHLALGASPDGKLQALIHEVVSETSTYEDYSENIVNWSGMLYQCPNVRLTHKVSALTFPTPSDMRAPGATTGVWALESAIDELAFALHMDPLALRLTNYAEEDQNEGKPFSSKALRDCYTKGAQRFGWATRPLAPRSMKEGKNLIGFGMATGVWDASYTHTSAKATLFADGTLEVASATSDIGTGTYTIMTQIAAETLGVPMERVKFKLGDSDLPTSPVEGGSWTAASCGSAVKEACDGVKEKLLAYGQKVTDSPLKHAKIEEVIFADQCITLRDDASKSVSFADAMRAGKVEKIEESTAAPKTVAMVKKGEAKYTSATHSAVFVEVAVDEDLGTVRVRRVVSAIAAGRILNPKTARSQILGAVVWGIGMALEEGTFADAQLGRYMNHNLSEYHVPVNADIHDIDVIFVEETDPHINPIGVKGVGEIGIVGVAAAIANAIFHATGKRVRDLPITMDKVLGLT